MRYRNTDARGAVARWVVEGRDCEITSESLNPVIVDGIIRQGAAAEICFSTVQLDASAFPAMSHASENWLFDVGGTTISGLHADGGIWAGEERLRVEMIYQARLRSSVSAERHRVGVAKCFFIGDSTGSVVSRLIVN